MNVNKSYHENVVFQNYLTKLKIFAGWEPYGEYIKHIIESHSYMQNTYKGKPIVWSYCLDIFHYIYNSPWTQALKNKRILLISPFTKTLEEQIPIRHLMYNNVNLFPNCEFILLKPPQTQADQPAREFGICSSKVFVKGDINNILLFFKA